MNVHINWQKFKCAPTLHDLCWVLCHRSSIKSRTIVLTSSTQLTSGSSILNQFSMSATDKKVDSVVVWFGDVGQSYAFT